MGSTPGRSWAMAVVAVATAIVVVVLYLWAGGGSGQMFGTRTATPLFDEELVVAVYDRVSPAVVEVLATRTEGFPRPGLEEPLSTGSGFLLDREGWIATNHHVIAQAETVRVRFRDGRTVQARVVGRAPDDDLALLKVPPEVVEGITPVTLGDSDQVRPGQLAIALGSPFGLEGSVTVGVISGVDRSLTGDRRPITGVLQTDASLNPGNSGGPLLNSQGEVVGINTAIQRASLDEFQGRVGGSIGFAVPVNSLRALLPRLQEGGVVGRPYLGIRGVAVDSLQTQHLQLPVDEGVYVCEAVPGSPADQAGLRAMGWDENNLCRAGSDIILSVDGRAVTSVPELAGYLNTKWPGDQVTLEVLRGETTLELVVTLGDWPQETPAPR